MHRFCILISMLCLAIPAMSAVTSSPQSANLTPSVTSGDVSRYNIKVTVSGKTVFPGTSGPTDIDAAFELVILHKSGQVNKDGSYQLTVETESASATVSGQKIPLAKDMFPNMTVLVDKNGDISRILAADPTGVKLPGLNYRNLILLFHPNAPPGDAKVGAAWSKTVVLAPDPDKYCLNYTLLSVGATDGQPSAKIKTELAIVPPSDPGYAAKGSASTDFSLNGGKLLKSHAEMTVKTPVDGTSTTAKDVSATVKVDISRVCSPQQTE